MTTETDIRTITVKVSGRVQGVWFRGSARDVAGRLRVTGWARNCDDGSVEVVACGESSKLDEFVAWLRQGPRLARVDAVEVSDIELDTVPVTFAVL